MSYLSTTTGNGSFLGYFATPAALTSAFPVAVAGAYAIVGSTDTIWIWDVGTVAWVNSGTAGSGDVVGPASATDNAIARYDSTTGKLIQDSIVTISDTGVVSHTTNYGVGRVFRNLYTEIGNTDFARFPYIGFNARLTFSDVPTTTNEFSPTNFSSASASMGILTTVAGQGDLSYLTFVNGVSSSPVNFGSFVTRFTINATTGNTGIGVSSPSATLHLKAGTATANSSPLKFTAGTVLTTPEAGTMEFTNSETGLTFTAVGTRRQVVLDSATQALTNKTYNGNTFTPGTGILTIAAAKTLTVSNTITLAGTDATVMTFPTTSATIARTDAAQTFTGVQTFSTPIAATSLATMTATVGGAVPTPPNNTTTFLRGDGTFAVPAGGGDMVLASVQTNTGAKTFLNNTLLLRNPGNTFSYTITTAAITADRVLNLPLITGTDTVAVLGLAQTFVGVQSMTSPAITTSITTPSTSFDAFNTVATTLNIGGAATTLNIGGTPTTAVTFNIATNPTATATTKTLNIGTAGAAGSTTNVNIGSAVASAILGTLSLNFPTILTAANNTTVSLWNTNSTTINFAGAATTLNIGLTGTVASTTNIATGAVAAATTKTVNIGTGGAASSTTNVTIGSANGGTTNIASPVLQNNGVVVPTISSTNTLTNKRITNRVSALSANSATPAVNTDNFDVVNITGQTATITGFTMTGTPVDGDTLRISITGTASVPFTLGSSFEASTVALPTTTVGTARLDMGFLWNSATSKWRCVAVA